MKQENIISNIVLGVCTILLVVVVLSNVYTFFPALTNSLGTLSDWFMVLITGITALFLYKTLKSQTEVQRDQKLLTEIELKKHRLSIKPQFSFRIDGGNLIMDKDNEGEYYQSFNLWIRSNHPCIFTVEIEKGSHLELGKNSKQFKHIYPNESNVELITPNYNVFEFSDGLASLTVGIVINYSDKEYNNYQFKSTIYIKEELTNNFKRLTVTENIKSDKYIKNSN